jgi:hypothetical protein
MKGFTITLLTAMLLLSEGCASRQGETLSANGAAELIHTGDAPVSSPGNVEPATAEPEWSVVAPEISLTGTASKGIDSANTSSARESYTIDVEVRLKNTGAAALTFDTVELAFTPGKAKPLRLMVTSYAPSNKLDEYGAPMIDKKKVLTKTVNPGDEEKWNADTDGYTHQMITQAGGEPVVFSIALLSKGRKIAGPFRASLPDLDSLPLIEKSAVEADKHAMPGVRLRFQ